MAPVSYLFRIHAAESPGASCDEVKDKTCGLVDATSVRYIVPGYFQRIGPMKGLELKVPPLALVFLAGGCMWLITRAVPAFGLVSPAHVAPAVGVVIIGLVIAGTGIVSFRMAKTTVNPMKPESSSTLVVTGIYRMTRNPMYLGFLSILFGWGIFLSNILALLILPSFVLYMNRFQIEPEERALTNLFGRAFVTYRDRVRRWI